MIVVSFIALLERGFGSASRAGDGEGQRKSKDVRQA